MLALLQGWVPLVVSVTALLVTAVFNFSTHVDRKAAARLAREKELHAWVQRVGDAYSTLLAGDAAARQAALSRLFVLVDFGRLFFPNDQANLRSRVLDPLVETAKRCAKGDASALKIRQDWRELTNQLNKRTTAFAINTSPEAEGQTQYRNP